MFLIKAKKATYAGNGNKTTSLRPESFDLIYSEGDYMSYDLYLQGKSILGIIKELARPDIKSPTGKDKWSKRTIDVMVCNEKYTVTVRLLDNGKHEADYLCENNNPTIISKETFKAVQIETMLENEK